jgi:protein phosphatase
VLVWEEGEVDAHEYIAPTLEKQEGAASGDGSLAALKERYSSRGANWEDEVGCAAEPPHVARLDGEIVRMIKERICRHRHALSEAFARLDGTGSGHVSCPEWEGAMAAVLQLDIPWAKYRPWLAELTEEGAIEYAAFLGRFEVGLKELYAGWQASVLQKLYNSLLAADLKISELLAFFDNDGDGKVTEAECTRALGAMDLGLSAAQTTQLVQQLGFVGGDSESRISLEQFLRALAKAADHSVIARTEQEKRDLQAVALWIEDSRRRTGSSLAATFKMWDADADGFLDYEEFVSGCAACQGNADQASLPYVYTNDEFDELARTVDQAKTGRINYLSFLGLFSLAEGENATPLGRVHHKAAYGVIESICATLWSNDVVLAHAFRAFDSPGRGTISPLAFRNALTSMNTALAAPYEPITPEQIELLVSSLPLDYDGLIDYKEFMASFEVRDADLDA